RMGFHGCQMPEQLLGRIIRTSSNPRELVLDPFTGSGTTLAVAKKLGRKWIGFELSEEYARQARTRIKRVFEGQSLDGDPEPMVSAPRTPGRSSKLWLRSGVQRAIIEAFLTASDGWSSDRVIVDPELNQRFCAECRDLGLPGRTTDWNWTLMLLRKAGKLNGLPKSRRTTFPFELLDRYLFASEIAMRLLMDETSQSLDEILCDPELATRFDQLASQFAPDFSPLHYRWGALHIRKRTKDWRQRSDNLSSNLKRRDFQEFHSLRALDIERWNQVPGVYLERASSDCNLYVGATFDLGKRLQSQIKMESWPGFVNNPKISVINLNEHEMKDCFGFQSLLIGRYSPKLNLNLAAI